MNFQKSKGKRIHISIGWAWMGSKEIPKRRHSLIKRITIFLLLASFIASGNSAVWADSSLHQINNTKNLPEVQRGSPTPGIIILEGVGAISGGLVGFAAGTFLFGGIYILIYRPGPPLHPDSNGRWMLLPGYFIGYPIGSALGSYAVGSLFRQEGSFWKSLLCAQLTALIWTGVIGYCLAAWGPAETVPVVEKLVPGEVWVLGVFLLPSSAAVIGYNLLRRPKPIGQSYFIPAMPELTTVTIGSGASKENIHRFRWNLIRVKF